MASSLLALSDLINFQIERFDLNNFIYKDELQLTKHLVSLDEQEITASAAISTTTAKNNEKKLKHSFKSQHSKLKNHEKKEACTNTENSLAEKRNTSSVGSKSVTSINEKSRDTCGNAHYASQDDDVNVGIEGNSYEDGLFDRPASKETLIRGDSSMKSGATGHLIPSNNSDDDDSLCDPQKTFRSNVIDWFQQLRDSTADFKCDEESRRLREAGNDSYRKERHSLKACDYYTEAIFLAPAEDNIAAAMAHANRSTVLHDCGMYAQSYDDCLCALELGYPNEYIPLIKLRQAACALKLRNFSKCEEHLHELLHMELSDALQERTHTLWHEYELLKDERVDVAVQTSTDDLERNGKKLYDIVSKDNCNARTSNKSVFLRASSNIASNMPVFSEETTLFVPTGEARICDNCAITQFIPFPCIYCSNRSAVYCSRKCRAEHSSVHVIECFAHQIELFEEFSDMFSKPRLLQLAFRMLITGLPQVVPHCRKKPTVNKMWSAFNGVLTERTDIPYSALLRLEAHHDSNDLETLVSLAVIAHILAIYLNECTDFFESLQLSMPITAKLSSSEWELLATALLLRHIAQLRHKNLIHCPSFTLPADPHIFLPSNEFRLWAAIKRLHPGYLHLLAGNIATVSYAVYPHTLSLCRHSCKSMIFCKFSERKVTTFATCDILTGTNIYNCFVSGNYQQSLLERRKLELKSRGMECRCEKCFRSKPDDDFHKFHRYRCDNPNCLQIFTPIHLEHSINLRWWESDYYKSTENKDSDLLVCGICKKAQKLEWFWTFNAALLDCDSIEERCKLYAAIERADTQLVELHECKVALAQQLVEQCLYIHRDATSQLDAWEFNKLGSIMRSALHIVAAQYRMFSMHYVKYMSYFWDVMALSNYKCNEKELMQMLNALEFIPVEYKEIFLNYYEDYIAPKFYEENYTTIKDTQV